MYDIDGRHAAITAGGGHTCAIAADGTINCWGNNGWGHDSPPAGRFTAIAFGARHTCALAADGAIECWGWREYIHSPAAARR